MIKKIISIFIAFVLCFSLSFNFVGAYSLVDFTFDDNIIFKSESNLSSDDLIKIYKAFSKNPNLSEFGASSNSLAIQAYKYPNTDQLLLRLTSSDYLYDIGAALVPSSSNSTYDYISINTSLTDSNLANFSTMHFSLISHSITDSMYSAPVYYKSLQCFIQVSSFNIASNVVGSPSYNRYYSFIYNYPLPFVPSSYNLYGLDLSINDTSFRDWIIENDKLSELPSYITSAKLLSFIDFYSNYGGSFSNFLKNIPDWFSYMNIANQSKDNVNILKSSMDRLYQEYLNSFWRVVGYPNSSNLPHHRRNIQTQTTDDNITLITDDSNDTVDISILRDILRGIIQVSNLIADGTVSVINKLDQLDFTVNVANGGGSFSAAEIWGTGDITQSSNYQALSDAFVEHGVVISNVESLQYNYLAGQTQKDFFTVSVDMPDEYVNGEFTKKTITHTVDSNSKMYDTLVLFRKIIALAVILYYVVRLKLALPSLIKGE